MNNGPERGSQLALLVLGVTMSYGGLAWLVWHKRRTIQTLRHQLQVTSTYLHVSNALLREIHDRKRPCSPADSMR